jgi:predicted metal-dependent hydrolase
VDFAEQQRPWIERQQRRAEEQRGHGTVLSPQALKELRGRAMRELPHQLRRLAARHGLTVSRVSIRNQQSRWGSCSPNGHICLNWRLMLLPAFVREYVLIHELMHLKRLDHSRRFWNLVAQACGNYQEARRWLRQNERLVAISY